MEKLEELKQKLMEKINKEYADLITDLKKLSPEQIIERSYESVIKKEMIYTIKNRTYDITELKALLKSENILNGCYEEWRNRDGNFDEILEYPINEQIDLIVREYKEEKARNFKESR